MKRVFKLLGLVLAVVVALKLNDIYHNVYPKFKSEACVECQELTEAPNGKTVNLFFRDTMSEGCTPVGCKAMGDAICAEI